MAAHVPCQSSSSGNSLHMLNAAQRRMCSQHDEISHMRRYNATRHALRHNGTASPSSAARQQHGSHSPQVAFGLLPVSVPGDDVSQPTPEPGVSTANLQDFKNVGSPKGKYLCVVSGNSKRIRHIARVNPPELAEVANILYLYSFLLPVDALMLHHWLAHYHSLGVRPDHTNVAIRLDVDVAYQADLNATLQVLTDAGVPRSNVRLFYSAPSDDLKMQYINTAMNTLPKDSWFIYADVDEHFDYQCNINKANLEKYKCILGAMWDQAAANGNMSEAHESPSLMDQFPHQCRLRTYLTPRLMMYKTIITTTGGGRFAKRHFRSTHATNLGCKQLGIVRHYSITGQQLANNAERKSIKPQQSVLAKNGHNRQAYTLSVNYANATCGKTDPITGACKDYEILHNFMVRQVKEVAERGSAQWVRDPHLCPRTLLHDRYKSASYEEEMDMFKDRLVQAQILKENRSRTVK